MRNRSWRASITLKQRHLVTTYARGFEPLYQRLVGAHERT
jgi:hypothetical protein